MPGSGKTTSVWMQNRSLELTEELKENIRTQVCVIGGGLAGLTTAYLLSRNGQSVVVIDDGEIGGGETSRTTAHLSNIIDDRFFEVERVRGQEASRLASESHAAAIDQIEAIITEENIDCDFLRVSGYLFNPPNQSSEILEKEFIAARRAGADVEFIGRAPFDGFNTGRCLQFPRQAQCHVLKYLTGLCRATQELGGRIFTKTRAVEIQGGANAHVKTHQGIIIKADHIVVATNSPINDRVSIHTKLYPYRTYVIAASIPSGSVPLGLYWDTVDPYHYVRVQPTIEEGMETDNDLLIIGGEDHKTGHADDASKRYARLEAWARERFPMLQEVELRWSGQVMETLDGLAYIGHNPLDHTNVYIATGDSGMGMTHGTISGMLIRDLILGRNNPWTSLYHPGRKPVSAVREYLAENLDVARQYLDWITESEVQSPEQIQRCMGAILRRGTSRIAVYRDEHGNLHEVSAKCSHLQCVVRWNSGERTWDCPCHGSRYSSDGTVLNGPANHPLPPAIKKI